MTPPGLLKMFAPKIAPAIDQGQGMLKEYLDSLPLEEGETGTTVLIDFDQTGAALLRVVALRGKILSRLLGTYKKDDLLQLIGKVL